MLSGEPLTEGLRRSNLVPKGRRVLVALSGGPDSTALLVALVEEGHDVVAAHYDHALRTDSGDDALFAAQLCKRLGVPLATERRRQELPRGSVQAAARALRYAFLERARVACGAEVVALAHTANDVVEGVALHLLRGCGIGGLRGMPAQRGVFARPLLDVWREDVLGFLHRREIAWTQDPSNTNTSYERVRLRAQILPALERDCPGLIRRLHRVASRAALIQSGIEAAAHGLLEDNSHTREALERAPEPVAAEALRLMYARVGGPEPGLSRHHIEAMLRLVGPGRGGRGVDLPGGYRFRVNGSAAAIVEKSTTPVVASLEIRRCKGCDQKNAVHLKSGLDLWLGHRRPGLTLRPLGGRGTRKLQDVFVDARVPREERDAWPLVFAGDRLAWVPGVAVDAQMIAEPGDVAQHISISRRLDRERSEPVLKSIDSPRGERN